MPARAAPLVLLALAVVVAGCTRGGDEEATIRDALPESPHQANVESSLPFPVTATLVVTGPFGDVLHEQTLEIDAGHVARAPVPVAGSGLHRVDLSVAWSHDGRGGSTSAAAGVDPDRCAGAWLVTFVLEERDGTAQAGGHATCERT